MVSFFCIQSPERETMLLYMAKGEFKSINQGGKKGHVIQLGMAGMGGSL